MRGAASNKENEDGAVTFFHYIIFIVMCSCPERRTKKWRKEEGNNESVVCQFREWDV